MKLAAVLLLSSLTIALVVAFPDSRDAVAPLPVAGQHVAALASATDAQPAEPSSEADQDTNAIRQPRYILSKLFQPKTVVVQPIIVEPVRPVYGYQRPYSYYKNGRW
ncbi:hypothetical protein KR009_011412 [Drosophila setifemur]|nr:hypothetical protein KR009_011412 [Drosophila setifemur]